MFRIVIGCIFGLFGVLYTAAAFHKPSSGELLRELVRTAALYFGLMLLSWYL